MSFNTFMFAVTIKNYTLNHANIEELRGYYNDLAIFAVNNLKYE